MLWNWTALSLALRTPGRFKRDAEAAFDELKEGEREMGDLKEIHRRELEALGHEVQASAIVGDEVQPRISLLT